MSIPVIASGGAGTGDHFVEVFKAGCADAALAASIFHFGIHDVRELKAICNAREFRCGCHVDKQVSRLKFQGSGSHSNFRKDWTMLIPSIDLMGGKVVQLVQGEKKALEFDDLQYWIDRFLPYPMVQLIDLDAAMGKGENTALIHRICQHLPVQVGGGIRTVDAAHRRCCRREPRRSSSVRRC